MLKYGNKEYRNLQEQVLANMRNIEDIIKDKPTMVNNISLNGSTYTPSDGTITLPGLVTTGTEQTVSAKKNFTNTIEVKGAEINAETRIGTYPRSIESTGILDVDLIVEEWIAGKEVDFEKHTISSGAYLYFEYPELLEHYGLHGDDGASSAPYSNYALNKDISIPETITTEAQLKAYVKSSAFASDVDSAGYTIDEYIIVNSVAAYASDIQDIFFDGTNIIVYDILDCREGEGEQIVGASDPITEPMLKTKNLKVENLEVENRIKELNVNNAKFANLEITDKLVYSGSSELKLKGVQPTLTRHYVRLQDSSNNSIISATFIFRKSTKVTSMSDFINTLIYEYGIIPSNLPFFGTGFVYTITFINSTRITAYGFNMVNASAVVNPNIKFLDDTISIMGVK